MSPRCIQRSNARNGSTAVEFCSTSEAKLMSSRSRNADRNVRQSQLYSIICEFSCTAARYLSESSPTPIYSSTTAVLPTLALVARVEERERRPIAAARTQTDSTTLENGSPCSLGFLAGPRICAFGDDDPSAPQRHRLRRDAVGGVPDHNHLITSPLHPTNCE